MPPFRQIKKPRLSTASSQKQDWQPELTSSSTCPSVRTWTKKPLSSALSTQTISLPSQGPPAPQEAERDSKRKRNMGLCAQNICYKILPWGLRIKLGGRALASNVWSPGSNPQHLRLKTFTSNCFLSSLLLNDLLQQFSNLFISGSQYILKIFWGSQIVLSLFFSSETVTYCYPGWPWTHNPSAPASHIARQTAYAISSNSICLHRLYLQN